MIFYFFFYEVNLYVFQCDECVSFMNWDINLPKYGLLNMTLCEHYSSGLLKRAST